MLKAQVWVAALLRRAQAAGAFAAVSARGDDDAGDVIVKVNLLDGRARVLAAAVGADGRRTWTSPISEDAPVPEPEADAFLRRRREIDPDAWVVEIEDRAGRDFIVD